MLMIRITHAQKKFVLFMFMCTFLAVLLSSFIFALGYSPLTVYGQVSKEAQPVDQAKILVHILKNQSLSFVEETITNEKGEFLVVLTREDNEPIDLQISTSYAGEVYVDVVEDATPWNTYSLVLNLDSDEFAEVKRTSHSSRSDNAFDADMARIASGEVLEDQELLDELTEKYNMLVVNMSEEESREEVKDELEVKGQGAVLEEPSFVPAPKPSEGMVNKRNNVLKEFLMLVTILLCFLAIIIVIKHEK